MASRVASLTMALPLKKRLTVMVVQPERADTSAIAGGLVFFFTRRGVGLFLHLGRVSLGVAPASPKDEPTMFRRTV